MKRKYFENVKPKKKALKRTGIKMKGKKLL
jgi:hypothetical protein